MSCCSSCGCGGKKKKGLSKGAVLFVKLAVFAAFSLFFYTSGEEDLKAVVFWVAYVVLAKDVFVQASEEVGKSRVFGEGVLMSVATLGAAFLGEFVEALAVLAFYAVGEFLEKRALDASNSLLTNLASLKNEKVTLLRGGVAVEVKTGEAAVGEVMLIKPFEKISLDCVILPRSNSVLTKQDEEFLLDTAALTGESQPRHAKAGDELLSGFINGEVGFEARVLRTNENSALTRVIALVAEATKQKAKAQKFIAKFSAIYTPIVILAALLIAVLPFFFTGEFYTLRALTLLVIACPCAFVLGVRLVYFSGVAACAKQGVIVKKSLFLDALNDARVAFFDKTLTLSKGEFSPVLVAFDKDFLAVFKSQNEATQTFLDALNTAEFHSHHPLAKMSLKFCQNKARSLSVAQSFAKNSGVGVKLACEEEVLRGEILAGSREFLAQNGVVVSKNLAFFDPNFKPVLSNSNLDEFNLFLSINGKFVAALKCEDTPKKEAKEALRELEKLGLKSVILSGDSAKRVQEFAAQVGVSEFYAPLLPSQKAEKIAALKGSQSAIFVGDGVNDAPALASADVGVAVGDLDIATQAADVILVENNLLNFVKAVKISRFARQILWQNILFSFAAKVVVLTLGAFGGVSMAVAIFADTGVTALVALNAIRILKKKF